MNLYDLTVAQCEAVAGPAAGWVARCHEVADLVNNGLKLRLYLAYGGYFGDVNPNSPLYRPRAPFSRHGWLETLDDPVTIVDPTRWVFENASPYIYVGPNPLRLGYQEYDLGNDNLRFLQESYKEPPVGRSHHKLVPLEVGDADAEQFIRRLFQRPPADLDLLQVAYLANLSRRTLGRHMRPIFRAIVLAGQKALIPTDNYKYAFGRGKPVDAEAGG